jgi:nucleotide-binding universal stress UspA family protein
MPVACATGMLNRPIRRMLVGERQSKETAMFKTIVWATDGSEAADQALPYVKSLAQESGAALVVVHAVEAFVTSYAAGLPVFGDEDELKAKVKRQTEELQSEGVTVDSTVIQASGVRPAHLIAEAARDVNADLIVVGTRGHTPVGGLLLGSVTQRLLHIAPCPVLAVPATAQPGEPEAAAAGTTAAPS